MQSALGKRLQDCRRGDMPVGRRQTHDLDTGVVDLRALTRQDDAADSVRGQNPRGRRQTPPRIDHDPHRTGSRDPADGELRVIGQRGAYTDDHRIDQRPQAVEVSEAGRPVDVFRMAGRRGDAGIDRLAELPDHRQAVDPRTVPQRPKDLLPGRGEGAVGIVERPGNVEPGVVRGAARSRAVNVCGFFRSGRHRVMIVGETNCENARIAGRRFEEQLIRSWGLSVSVTNEWYVVNSRGDGWAGLLGMPDHVAVERGLAEIRSVRPVIVTGADETIVALPVDGMDDGRLASFRRLCAPARPYLVVTARRSLALGREPADLSGLVGLSLADNEGVAAVLSLAADAHVERSLDVVPVSGVAGAAVELAKLAQRLPALLIADGRAAAACDPPLIRVVAGAVAHFRQAATASLTVAAEANVPLNGGLPARFV